MPINELIVDQYEVEDTLLGMILIVEVVTLVLDGVTVIDHQPTRILGVIVLL